MSNSAVHHDTYPHSHMGRGYSGLCLNHSPGHGSQEDSDICIPVGTRSCYKYSSVCKYGEDDLWSITQVCSVYTPMNTNMNHSLSEPS